MDFEDEFDDLFGEMIDNGFENKEFFQRKKDRIARWSQFGIDNNRLDVAEVGKEVTQLIDECNEIEGLSKNNAALLNRTQQEVNKTGQNIEARRARFNALKNTSIPIAPLLSTLPDTPIEATPEMKKGTVPAKALPLEGIGPSPEDQDETHKTDLKQ